MKTQVSWTGLWQGWLGHRVPLITRAVQAEEEALRRDMEAARREVEWAEQYFQTVVDPELVDHAIFTLEAAKRKYLYLYRRLRSSRTAMLALSQAQEHEEGQEQVEWG